MKEKEKLLDPRLVSRLKNIDLKARLVVEGFMTGLHESPYHGFSVEFAEHRPYLWGDPIKLIDWRVYGRTDKYYVKEYEEETNLKSYIFLDLSDSMSYSSNEISKEEYAKTICAAMSYMMIKQRDAVGLIQFNDSIKQLLQPKSKQTQLRAIFKALEKGKTEGRTDISKILGALSLKIKRRGLIILISDLLEPPEKTLKALKYFHHQGHEIIVFHILDPQEINFDFREDAEFIDLETNEKISTQPYYMKESYRESMGEILSLYREECEKNRVDYQLITTDMTYDKALYYFLEKRRKLN